METLKTAFILSALLACYSGARRSKEVYKISIDERGTRFNETVVINDKEKHVVYTVPEHNGVVGSAILFDYKTGYFATRIPKLKECYIQRISKGYSSPGLVRKNLERYRVFKESQSAVPVKTIKATVAKGQKIDSREISFSLSTFCGDFAAYQAIQINHQELFPMGGNVTNGKVWQKRYIKTYPIFVGREISVQWNLWVKRDGKWVRLIGTMCKKYEDYITDLEKDGCALNTKEWLLDCGAQSTSNCLYTIQCRRDTGIFRCKETHYTTDILCCQVRCSKSGGR
ncbi:Hypothetical predicted protein [Paramuricea clavata]|uniref:Uncharacterized protein n=1 Tax=Paramuricea clavata TaxID=317549 RepID=A0A6S7HRP5_PARCT|nr:Hypothetical predicted protein [Paramuricea clavata]